MIYNIDEYLDDMRTKHYWGGTYHAAINPTNYTSGNHHVINSTHLAILDYHSRNYGSVDTMEHLFEYETVETFINKCWVPNKPGRLNRAPTKIDFNAHDDYLAVRAKHKNLGDIIEIHGKSHSWWFDNTGEMKWYNPVHIIKCWHAKFPWLLNIYKTKPGIFYQLWYCGHLFFDMYQKDRTNVSGRILSWISIDKTKNTSKLVNYFISKWLIKMDKVYPNGIGEMLEIYHGSVCPNTPMAVIMTGQKFIDTV